MSKRINNRTPAEPVWLSIQSVLEQAAAKLSEVFFHHFVSTPGITNVFRWFFQFQDSRIELDIKMRTYPPHRSLDILEQNHVAKLHWTERTYP